MKLSYFTIPLHPLGRDYTTTLAEDREAILLADALGFADAFVGEHVTDRAETITSCLMFLASLAYETAQIRLGSGTVNLPNAHPAAVAAQVAMLDHMLGGRFVFGISPGGLRSDAEVFGNLERDRRAMFDEAIEQVLAIWAGEPPYDLDGEFWQITTRNTLDLDNARQTESRLHSEIVTADTPQAEDIDFALGYLDIFSTARKRVGALAADLDRGILRRHLPDRSCECGQDRIDLRQCRAFVRGCDYLAFQIVGAGACTPDSLETVGLAGIDDEGNRFCRLAKSDGQHAGRQRI